MSQSVNYGKKKSHRGIVGSIIAGAAALVALLFGLGSCYSDQPGSVEPSPSVTTPAVSVSPSRTPTTRPTTVEPTEDEDDVKTKAPVWTTEPEDPTEGGANPTTLTSPPAID